MRRLRSMRRTISSLGVRTRINWPLTPMTLPSDCWNSRGLRMWTWSPSWMDPLGSNGWRAGEVDREGRRLEQGSGDGVETRGVRSRMWWVEEERIGCGEERGRLASNWEMWSISACARCTLESATERERVAEESADVRSARERGDADEIEDEEEARLMLPCIGWKRKLSKPDELQTSLRSQIAYDVSSWSES